MSDSDAVGQTRNEIVRAYWESVDRSSARSFRNLTPAQRRKEYATEDRLLDAYAQCLPAVPVTRCPICGEVLE